MKNLLKPMKNKMTRDCQYNTQLTFDSHNLHKTLISSTLLPSTIL